MECIRGQMEMFTAVNEKKTKGLEKERICFRMGSGQQVVWG